MASSSGLPTTASRGIVTLDLTPLDARSAPACSARPSARSSIGPRSNASWPNSRWSWSFTWRRCCRRAPSSRRARPTTSTCEGTLNLLEFAQHEAESHGRPVVFLYPSSIAAYGLPSLDAKRQAGRVSEDELDAADDDVWLQQAVLRAAGRLLRAALQAAGGRAAQRARRFPRRPVSGADFGGDGAVGRHVGLRAGDDPRRRERASRTPVSSGRTRAFRSWRCPTASTRCWRWRRRRARA